MKKRLLVLVAAMMFILASCGSKPTLSSWVNSKDVTEITDQMNSSYEALGMSVKFSAEGDDILVMTLDYDEATYGAGFDALDADTLKASFEEQVPTLETGVSPMIDACKEDLGIELSAIRVRFTCGSKELFSTDITK